MCIGSIARLSSAKGSRGCKIQRLIRRSCPVHRFTSCPFAGMEVGTGGTGCMGSPFFTNFYHSAPSQLVQFLFVILRGGPECMSPQPFECDM